MSISAWWFDSQRALFLFVCRFFASFCFGSCGFTIEYLKDLIHPILLSPVRLIIYLACIYTYGVLLPLLLLGTGGVAEAAASVRHRVPDGKQCCWLIESISIACFISLQTRYVLNLCIPWQCCRIYGRDIPIQPR